MTSYSSPQYTKLTLRQPLELKQKVEQAAALLGMSVTSFVNSMLERSAEQTIERIERRRLSAKASQRLLEMLADPPDASAALIDAMKQHRERLGGR